jgi:hypothetical protein
VKEMGGRLMAQAHNLFLIGNYWNLKGKSRIIINE